MENKRALFSEKKAHKIPTPPNILKFLVFRSFLNFSMFLKNVIAFYNRRQKLVRICPGNCEFWFKKFGTLILCLAAANVNFDNLRDIISHFM